MNGRIELIITEGTISADVELELHNGLADKCMILETMCKALKLSGSAKRVALAAVAMKDISSEDKE